MLRIEPAKNKVRTDADRLMIGIFVLFNFLLVTSLYTEMGWFYFDAPTHIIAYSNVDNAFSWFFRESERYFPLLQTISTLTSQFLGTEPRFHFVVQYCYTLIGWLFCMNLLSKMGIKTKYQFITMLLLVGISTFAEQMFTLGKAELLMCTGIFIYINALYSMISRASINVIWSIIYILGVFVTLFSKETGFIILAPGFLMSLYCFYFHKNKVGLKAFILLIISCLIYLGIRAKYKLAGTYVAIDLNVTEYINRLLWYIQYHPDIFILGIISTISCIYCWLSDKKSIMFAMLLVCNLTGWAYIVAICLWRMCLSYYLYPAVTFFAISFSSISGFQDHRKFKRAIASLMIIPLFYGVSYNYKVAVSHIDLGNVYTQSLESLLKHTKENDRVLCENWYFYEEPITQTNILLNHYSHPLNLYGIAQELLNGFNGIQWKDIALFGYSREDYESLKKEFIPREGDYLLVYLMSTEQPSVFRTVAKSRAANPEIVKKRTESFADSAAEWTEQPHAQLYLPASPSPDPFHISAFPG